MEIEIDSNIVFSLINELNKIFNTCSFYICTTVMDISFKKLSTKMPNEYT